MRKKIGIKILTIVLLLTIVFIATTTINSYSVGELSKSAKTIICSLKLMETLL